MKKTIGVLAMQGAVSEHLAILNQLPNTRGVAVKTISEIDQIDGLILPGGESTAIGKLLDIFDIKKPLSQKILSGLPTWGTCAGMILLAKEIAGGESAHLSCMDITVQRNGYGSQLNSFNTSATIAEVAAEEIPLIFIRAPYITKTGINVTPLYSLDGKIVAAKQANMLVTSFHPELAKSTCFHQYFSEKFVKQ